MASNRKKLVDQIKISEPGATIYESEEKDFSETNPTPRAESNVGSASN